MSIDSSHDPRSALVRTKYFSLHPKPLERWIWRQALPPAAERVFWLHWEAGMQNGDWCSEIPLKRVALECCVDPSTVTRAYQVLKSLSLIRREDPGRDPNNPFQQATAITEVRLPRDLVSELSRSPNRPLKALQSVPAHEAGKIACPPNLESVARPQTPNREETKALWGRVSAAEQSRYFLASRDRLTTMEFDSSTRLTPEDRGQILAQLAQLAAARPAANPAKASATLSPQGPRQLSILELARARKQILESVPAGESAELLRQVIWAAEQGALRRFPMRLAINTALKKIREGCWSRPYLMPPNWHPGGLARSAAAPEACSVA
jgi:hypothetical protein